MFDVDGAEPEELSDAICQIHALECASRASLMSLISAVDSGETWRVDGACSLADWLVARLGIGHTLACELVRVSRAVVDLPHLFQSFSQGLLSWDLLRAVVSFADSSNDESLSTEVIGWSVAQAKAVAREHRSLAEINEIDQKAHESRSVRWRWNRDESIVRISTRLAAEDGAVVVKALQRIGHGFQDDPEEPYLPYMSRYADALVEMAKSQLANDADPARSLVVLHADANDFLQGSGSGDIAEAASVPQAAVRRWACDASIQWIAHGTDGVPVGIARSSRAIPLWLARLVKQRDQGCRFPGCERERFVNCHHIVHWADGGPTDLDNLITLCSSHHRLLHEGRWTIRGSPSGQVDFLRPDNEVFMPRPPPPLRADVHERFASVLLPLDKPWTRRGAA